MDKIDEQLNNLKIVDVPVGLHGSIMKSVKLQKYAPFIVVMFVFFVTSFALLAWNINSKLIDAEFADMMSDLFEAFSLDMSFISLVVNSFFEVVSPMLMVYLVLCLGGILYTGRKIVSHSLYFA